MIIMLLDGWKNKVMDFFSSFDFVPRWYACIKEATYSQGNWLHISMSIVL